MATQGITCLFDHCRKAIAVIRTYKLGRRVEEEHFTGFITALKMIFSRALLGLLLISTFRFDSLRFPLIDACGPK